MRDVAMVKSAELMPRHGPITLRELAGPLAIAISSFGAMY
jgi:hypothetical protein